MSNKKKWSKLIKTKKWREVNRKDGIYKSYWLLKFLNKITKHGKKHKFEKIFYNILYKLKDIKHPLKIYYNTVFKSKFLISTQFKRFGKYFHRIPCMIKFPQSYKKGISNVVKFVLLTKKGSNNVLFNKIYSEIYNINKDQKNSISMNFKKYIYKIVKRNRAYMHFRWK